jgi:hypothetical protein
MTHACAKEGSILYISRYIQRGLALVSDVESGTPHRIKTGRSAHTMITSSMIAFQTHLGSLIPSVTFVTPEQKEEERASMITAPKRPSCHASEWKKTA